MDQRRPKAVTHSAPRLLRSGRRLASVAAISLGHRELAVDVQKDDVQKKMAICKRFVIGQAAS